MIEELEIHQKLAGVASGAIPVWDFYEWLDANSIDMHLDSSDEATELVGAINHIFAEYDRHIFNQQRLLKKLSALTHSISVFNDTANVAQVSITPIWWSAGSQLSPLRAPAMALQPL
jgi:hypothetical protein